MKLLPRLLFALAAVSPASLPAAGSMDGTYQADNSSALVTMIVPAQVYLVVNGRKATMIMRSAEGEDTLAFAAWVDGDKLLLTAPNGKRSDKGLVFYRRIGDSAILECLMCRKEGIPSVWVKMARER